MKAQNLARAFLDGITLHDITDLIEANAKGWDRLMAHCERELLVPSPNKRLAMAARIEKALSEDLVRLFRKYSDARSGEVAAQQEAAFLVGLELGRRLGGPPPRRTRRTPTVSA